MCSSEALIGFTLTLRGLQAAFFLLLVRPFLALVPGPTQNQALLTWAQLAQCPIFEGHCGGCPWRDSYALGLLPLHSRD